MDTDRNAKEALILKMVDGFTSRVTDGNIDALLDAVEPYRIDALAHALKRFREEEIEGYDPRFPPTVPQLVKQVRLFDEVLKRIDADKEGRPALVVYRIGEEPPPRAVPLGPTKISFNGGAEIDMSGMTHEEKEEVFRLRGPLPPKEPLLELVPPTLKRMGK